MRRWEQYKGTDIEDKYKRIKEYQKASNNFKRVALFPGARIGNLTVYRDGINRWR